MLWDASQATYGADLDVPANPLKAARTTVAALEEIERRSAPDRHAKLDAAGEKRDADYLLIREAQNAADHGDVASADWRASLAPRSTGTSAPGRSQICTGTLL